MGRCNSNLRRAPHFWRSLHFLLNTLTAGASNATGEGAVKTILLWRAGVLAICACVSGFPNILLSEGDRALQIAPTLDFAQKIKGLNQHRTSYKYVAPLTDGDSSTEADLADLRAALQQRGVKLTAIDEICRAHANERAKLGAPESDIEI